MNLETLTERLLAYVNGHADDADFIRQCAGSASDLVNDLVGDAMVPAASLELAIMEVGANLYARRTARQSRPTFTDTGLAAAAAPLPALNPLTPAYPLLARYLGPVIA